jgi:transcription elongation factor Elf1
MGKRKSSSAPAKKIKSVLDKTFTCLFCHRDKGIECKLYALRPPSSHSKGIANVWLDHCIVAFVA